MVLLESTAGSHHRIVAFRPKLATGRKEKIAFDPLVQQHVLYRELRKIRSLKKWSG
ncbi:large subunit ribosomal protein L33 [Paragonimus westermani]|uniref:39S ribosomal protein L33, mitochondrial n=1 Tax=Paragonimus westermani TaxID=34504 RepID=A0A5J4NR18_9TREM|nr:large subunit ribosomal protein L33 [Paragonimus westermani]